MKIEAETRKAGTEHAGPMDVEVRANGKAVAQGRVPRLAPPTYAANDAFEVGRDSYSTVSLAYFDRKAFAYNGRIDPMDVKCLMTRAEATAISIAANRSRSGTRLYGAIA